MEPPPQNTPSPTDARLPERKPWPMSWVVVAIVAYIIIQTVVNLEFRKPEKSHEPAAEAAERAKKGKFINASTEGWTRCAATIAPAGATDAPPGSRADVRREPQKEILWRELPFSLVGQINQEPSLHAPPSQIDAPVSIAANDALRLRLHFAADAQTTAFGDMLAFAKDNHLFLLVQDRERLAPGTNPVDAAPEMTLSVAPGPLGAGNWQATLYAKGAEFSWTFAVQ